MSNFDAQQLFVLGAMKSGTTSLHCHLAEHPEVFMTEPKETSFFVTERNWHKGFEWYKNLYANKDGAKIIGESSVDYTMSPRFSGVAFRIFKYNPKSKFIYIMRDPVRRTISHYWHNVRWNKERRGMLKAIQEYPDYIEFSYYYYQLNEYLSFFKKEQFYLLTFEDLLRSPDDTIKKVFSWLKIEDSATPPGLQRARNVTPSTIFIEGKSKLLYSLKYSNLWDYISTYIPKYIRDVGNNFALEKTSINEDEKNNVIEYLRPIQKKQAEELKQIFNHDLKCWTTLYG